jgi:hypothetical protein
MQTQSKPEGFSTGVMAGARRSRPIDLGTVHAMRKARSRRIAQEVTDRDIVRMQRGNRYGR